MDIEEELKKLIIKFRDKHNLDNETIAAALDELLVVFDNLEYEADEINSDDYDEED